MFQRIAFLLLVSAFLFSVGCGGTKDRGKYKDADRPRSKDKRNEGGPNQ